ncbi:hypothetical protein D081_0500 [Anaerovibrio sp. JC8]|uniref:hypothetical protein n=1 Tax=Anaerovibrio sp. JC8 TaxID=1240085 RepID=UPI000A0D444F|nr:hypothetical protein [Anaerovibrio sp. JC8]ORU01052.1 hypothetical protein D081_0500 [Anaerovibrio sp. JC8]
MRRKNSVAEAEQNRIDEGLKAHMYVSIDNIQEEKMFLEYFLKDDIVKNCYSNYSSGYDYMLSLNPQNSGNLNSFCSQMRKMLPSLKSTTMIYGGRQLK